MKSIFSLSFLILIIISAASCNTTEPPSNAALQLTLEDVSCTEAWISLTTTNIQLPATINLYKNNTLSKIYNLNTQDSLLYIDSLLPNQNYKFKAEGHSGLSGISSNAINTQTMDTTSHNFTWQTFTFGQHSSSVLYDVAIIDENNIWAVGEIYMNRPDGTPDPNSYNAVHWDGTQWELIKIGGYGGYPVRTVFAFAENDVWFDGVIKWDGANYTVHMNGWPLMPNGDGWIVNKMWGSSSNDIYAVGNGGNIAHYGGATAGWTKIESGTEVDLVDIWGNSNSNEIWACGYTGDYGTSTLIKIKDGIAEKIYEGSSNGQSNGYYIGPISGVLTDNNYRIFMMNGTGIYIQKNSNNFFLEREIAKFSDASFGIDGTKSNNIFACGEGFVGHWNGYSYREYPELYRQQRIFYSVKANSNIVCAVGIDNNSQIYSNAFLVIGHN